MRRWRTRPGQLGLTLGLLGACRGGSDSVPERGSDSTSVVAVSVAPIVVASLRDYVEGWGTVGPAPATRGAPPANARVAAPVSGLVAQVLTAEGERVEEGRILITLDARLADVAVSQARRAAQYAEQVFNRQQQLLASGITSQRQFQEAEQHLATARNELAAALTRRALLDVRAPVRGTVIALNAKPGDAVDPATALAEIVDLDRLVVTTGIRTGEIARVRRGQPATLRPDQGRIAEPGGMASGTVVYVGAQVDAGTDQVPVRVSVPASAGFRPGQYLRVRIAVEERPNRLAVPVESIITRDGVPMIAIVTADRATLRPVQVGLRDGGLVEVSGPGVEAAMTVATGGAYGLPPESRVRIIRP